MMKFGGGLARNIDFEVANFRFLVKIRGKTSIFELQLVKLEGSLAQMMLSRVSLRVSGCAVSMGEAAKAFVWEGVKVSKLEEVSHEMLVWKFARVWC